MSGKIKINIDKAKEIATNFCDWVLDESGNPREEFIDCVYEDDEAIKNRSIYLYVDFDEFYPKDFDVETDAYNEELFTFVELRGKGGDCIKNDRCLGTKIEDIAETILKVCN